MGSNTYSTSGAANWTCPATVASLTTVLIECRGAGGAGGAGNANAATGGGGGGGGGAYAKISVTGLVANNTYPYSVGAWGTCAVSGNGTTGGATYFNNNSSGNTSKIIEALGGNGGANNGANGAGGAANGAGGGITSYAGGRGNNKTATYGGGGGAAAGNANAGANSSGNAGATGTNGGGSGGAGGARNANGTNASNPGGGGGGAGGNNATTRRGGYGGNGQIVISWTDAGNPTVTGSDCTNVAAFSATANGNITDIGGYSVTRRGFCYMAGASGDPTTANSIVYEDGTWTAGAYSLSITGLSSSTAYRVRAYATSSYGTGYGTTVALTTSTPVWPSLLASRILLDADRSALSTSNDASVIDHVKTTKIILATQVGSIPDADALTYKLQWRTYVNESWATTTSHPATIWNGVAIDSSDHALSVAGVYNGSTVSTVNNWSGSAWATTASVSEAKNYLSGCGTTSSSIIMGGTSVSNLSTTEKWSGSSWATTGALITARYMHFSFGSSSSAITAGGNTGAAIATTEAWNGTSWATTGPLLAYQRGVGGSSSGGTTSTGIIFGGYGTTWYDTCELWSGTAWSTTSVLPTARAQNSGSGSTVAALSMGGTNVAGLNTDDSVKFNGTVWATNGHLTSTRRLAPSCGSALSNTLCFGGYSGSSALSDAMKFLAPSAYVDVASSGSVKWSSSSGVLVDGTSVTSGTARCTAPSSIVAWATTGSLSAIKHLLAGCGDDTNALAYGGLDQMNAEMITTEKWSGTAWATTGNLTVATGSPGGCGVTSAALCVVGTVTGSATNATKKWSGTAWATTGNFISVAFQGACCGTTTAAIYSGDSNAGTGNSGIWNGTSWATTGAFPIALWGMPAVGTTAAALAMGGQAFGSLYGNTSKWSGTAWATTTVLVTARYGNAAAGSTSSALTYGGGTVITGGVPYKSAEIWSGTSWATTVSMNTVRHNLAGCGSSSVALAFGGASSIQNAFNDSALSSNEKFSTITYSWLNGAEVLGENLSNTLHLSPANYSEIQWGLDLSDGVDGTTYDFLLYNNTGSAATGACGSKITVIAGFTMSFIVVIDDSLPF